MQPRHTVEVDLYLKPIMNPSTDPSDGEPFIVKRAWRAHDLERRLRQSHPGLPRWWRYGKTWLVL